MRSDLSRLTKRLRLPFWHRDDIEPEVASHLEDAEADLRAQGRAEAEARQAALEQLGDLDSVADSLQAIHQDWTGGATVQQRFLGVVLSWGVLAAGAALAGAAAFLAATHMHYAAMSLQETWGPGWRLGTIALAALSALCLPGFAAGLVLGAGGARVPQRRSRAGRVAYAAMLLGCGVVVLLIALETLSKKGGWPWPWPMVANLLGCLPRVALLPLIVIPSNAAMLLLGMRAGARVAGRAKRVHLVIAALLAALLLGGAWLWRDRVFAHFAVRSLVMRYAVARGNLRCADVGQCLTPEYLRRELGSPPYEPKLRQAFKAERARLDPGGKALFCLHAPGRLRRLPGTSALRAEVAYHYNGSSDRLGALHQRMWEITLVPWGRTWRIADMRLMQEGIPPEFKVAQGPAGTLRILSAPKQ